MTDLPLLPTTITRLHEAMEPGFVRVPEIAPGWFVIGPERAVVPGYPCRVYRWTTHDYVTVELDRLVAARVVEHKPGSRYGTGRQRYVLASIKISKKS